LPNGSNFDHTYFTLPLTIGQANTTYQLIVTFADVAFMQFDSSLRLAIGGNPKTASTIEVIVVGSFSGK
jgi:hypothetical protein